MIIKNYDESIKIDHNPNRLYIPDHPYWILIISGSGSGIDKIYLYIKDPFESKYQLLIYRREKVGIKKIKNPKALIDYSQAIGDVYEILEDCNPTKVMKRVNGV